MASGVVILLLLLGFKKDVKQSVAVNKDVEQRVPVKKDVEDSGSTLIMVLRWVMALDLFTLVVAYAAGASRDTLTTVLASVLVTPIFAYIVLHMVRQSSLSEFLLLGTLCGCRTEEDDTLVFDDGSKEDKRRRKILMLLAIFATTITYTVGLNPPGGFWPSAGADTEDEQHRAGEPVLQDHHRRRFVAFFVFNTASFMVSLSIVTLLLTGRFSMKFMLRLVLALLTKVTERFKRFLDRCDDPAAEDAPYAFTLVSLLGLVGAYAFGSYHETDSTISVIVLYLIGLVLVLLIVYIALKKTTPPSHNSSRSTFSMPF